VTTAYVFARWRKAHSGGREPYLVGVSGFLLLAEPRRGGRWALWEVEGFHPKRNPNAIPVKEDLRELIESALRYPPALAIARDDVERKAGPAWGAERLAAAYATALRRVMRSQPMAPFVLAEAVVEEIGYASAGNFYWVLRYIPPLHRGEVGTVNWVSGDYFIYTNRASDFRLTQAMLNRLRTRTRKLRKGEDQKAPPHARL
jgi:hypothetical protein